MSSIDQPRETGRQWATGLVVLATTIVSFFAFARVSKEWALIIGVAALAALLVFFWSVGRRRARRSRR